jgi:epsilon-lactone hydrolase
MVRMGGAPFSLWKLYSLIERSYIPYMPRDHGVTDAIWQPGGSAVAGVVRVSASPVGPVVHPPAAADLVILYLHGGRYLSGTPQSVLGLARCLALRTGAAVVCSRYRCVFPAALGDVHAGYRYSRAMGPVVVAGERIGAGLAASLLIQLRDAGATPPRGAVLVSALLDLTMQAPSLLLNAAADPALDAAELRRSAMRYAAETALADPLLSPLRANLHGLPPVQLLAAGTDLLLDDSVAFAARAARSGVTVDLRVRPDAASLSAHLLPAMAEFIGTWAAPG